MEAFKGFTSKTFSFLFDLSRQQSKEWFAKNRNTYEDHLVFPLKSLVSEVAPTLIQLNNSFEVSPNTNKTLTRINRDMRFAKGQGPYKDHMLILFYRVGYKKEDAQLFLGIQPNAVWRGLYIGSHLLGKNAPVRQFSLSQPGKLAKLGKKCHVNERYQLCICERYGQIKESLSAQFDENYIQGPHLAIMLSQTPKETISQGADLVTKLTDTIKDLYPLWSLYSGV